MNVITPGITIVDTKRCPVCGSDMKRDKTDNPHDVYTGHYTCCNQKCTVNAIFRN